MAEAIVNGSLTIPDLRNASSTTRALGGMRKIPPETPPPVPEPLDPILGAPSAAADDSAERRTQGVPTRQTESEPGIAAHPGGEVEELLDDLLVVLLELPADAWSAIAAAVPDELSERIERYLDAV